MPLTLNQRTFLDNHISRVKRKTARTRTKEAEAYAQQRERVLAQLERLPANSQLYKDLALGLKIVDSKTAFDVDALNFVQSTEELAALAQAKEAEVKNFDLAAEMAKARQRIDDIERAGLAAISARQQTAMAVTALKLRAAPIPQGLMPIPPQGGTLWVATAKPLLAHYRAEADAVENGAHNLAALLEPLNLFATAAYALETFVKSVDELIKAAHARNDNAARLQTFDLVQRLQFPQLSALRVLGSPDQFISRTNVTLEKQLARREVIEALQPLRDQLAALQADTGFEAGTEAAAVINAERQDDAKARATPQAPTGRRRPPPATFDLKSLMTRMPDIAGATLPGGSLNVDFAPDVSMLRTVGQQAQQALVAQLKAQGADTHSEAFFDLSLMSPEELALAFMDGKGWTGGKGGVMQAGHKAVVQAAGQAMFNLVLKANAERKTAQGQADGLSIDMAAGTLTLGDKHYGKPKELARGGLGAATRYENLSKPGDYVVVKSTISDPNDANASRQGRKAMKKEIVAHQRLMGAANDAQGRGNLAEMHGAVAAPDGTLHLVMEMIDGGDLATNRITDMLAAESGFLPEEARAVLNQARIKQAAEALKLMRDEGLVHFDVKDANFMMTADGTLKLIDFGSASQVGDDGRTKIVEGVTEGFAPARASATADSSFDTFALGKVMQLMHVNASSPGAASNQEDVPPEFQRMGGALARIGEAMTGADEGKRPTLEAVLASSYLKNLDNFDPAAVQALSAKTIAYGKALKAELAMVLPQLPTADVTRWAEQAEKQTNELSVEDIVRSIKLETEVLQSTMQAKRQQLQDLGPASVQQARGLAANRGREDRATTRLRRTLAQDLIALARQIPYYQQQLALFGQSPAALKLAAEMRDLSQQMLRPSAADVPTGPQHVNMFAINKLKRELGLRLVAADKLVKAATKTQPPHANTSAATGRFDAAKKIFDTDPKKAQVLLDQVDALLG